MTTKIKPALIKALGMSESASRHDVVGRIDTLLANEEAPPHYDPLKGGDRTMNDPRDEARAGAHAETVAHPEITFGEGLARTLAKRPDLHARLADWYSRPAGASPIAKWDLELRENGDDPRAALAEKAHAVMAKEGKEFGEALSIARAENKALSDRVDSLYQRPAQSGPWR